MKKILYLFSMLVSAMAILSCTKQEGSANVGEQVENKEMCKTVFRFHPDGQETTKALTIDDDNDDKIVRLDIYEFNNDGKCLSHFCAQPEELEAKEVHIYHPYGANYNYIFIANLDGDAADCLATKDISYWYSTTNLAFPVTLGTFDTHKIPMAGSAIVQYDEDKTVTLNLYRYMYKITVKDITADFDDESWMKKNVIIKGVALCNACEVLNIMGKYVYGKSLWEENIGTYEFFFPKTTQPIKTPFGGISGKVFYDLASGSSPNGTYSSNCSVSKYSGSHKYCVNSIYYKDRGELPITATGSMLEATYQEYSGYTGRVCSSTNPDQSHVLHVNKMFYAVPWKPRDSGIRDIVCEESNQDGTEKLVIIVEVGGKKLFYPIQICYPQPNTHYVIDNITLKSSGSEYANFYVKKYKVDYSIHVEPWNSVSIANIDCGEDE